MSWQSISKEDKIAVYSFLTLWILSSLSVALIFKTGFLSSVIIGIFVGLLMYFLLGVILLTVFPAFLSVKFSREDKIYLSLFAFSYTIAFVWLFIHFNISFITVATGAIFLGFVFFILSGIFFSIFVEPFLPKKKIVNEGEQVVNDVIRRELDPNVCYLYSDVTLPSGDGTTQIDHIVISPFGVFIIETKNMSGWIFANPMSKTWRQQIFKKSFYFQNPMHQNYKHVRTVQEILKINNNKIFSIVVFTGSAEFKTKMPKEVVYLENLIYTIELKKEMLLSKGELVMAKEKIERKRARPGHETDTKHIEYLRGKKRRGNGSG